MDGFYLNIQIDSFQPAKQIEGKLNVRYGDIFRPGVLTVPERLQTVTQQAWGGEIFRVEIFHHHVDRIHLLNLFEIIFVTDVVFDKLQYFEI